MVAAALAEGRQRFHEAPLPARQPGARAAPDRKRRPPVVRGNAGASLVDLGDGVLGVELHSKMNAIGGDALEMLDAGLEEASQQLLRPRGHRTRRRTSRLAPT